MRLVTQITAEVMHDQKHFSDISSKVHRLELIYEQLSRNYPTFDQTDDPWMTNGLSSTPFRCLVSVCLSTMTITPRVVKACVPLFERVSNFEELLALDDEALRTIIKPVAHYNRKTTNLKIMCQQILQDFGGRIPDTPQDLMKLQGVGRKVADIMMNFIFHEDTIAVDTHVLRVLNRLDIVHTSVAEAAADQINGITPAHYKRHAHEWLIQHGMQACTARRPRCGACCISELCSYR
ncbi:endonuclease III domain-containing protein [Malikia spinosa]|uniref:endonuclease III domain-containing protein n=1 Tax=Malikia spinosa TaxID=86180 RepID=UPI0027BA3DB8|nr:endonuclease III [Malikia spinosa]